MYLLKTNKVRIGLEAVTGKRKIIRKTKGKNCQNGINKPNLY